MHTLGHCAMWYLGIGLVLYVLFECFVSPNYPSKNPWWLDSVLIVCAYPAIAVLMVIRAYKERRRA